jgi:hypothetical protein
VFRFVLNLISDKNVLSMNEYYFVLKLISLKNILIINTCFVLY